MRVTPQRRYSYFLHAAENARSHGNLNLAARYDLEAAKAEAEIKPACRCCHTPLSAPESIARGMGPHCAGKAS